ncbi:hypothetical protein ASPWEDRAFT_34696 [Aspergillus wentii DTO 134E9]|uniref:MARVEL domain-containing protein n=1 Tax=Aspergillus wentii DTO 134E9 TaxID=1073089 RepID=A0A1L9S1Z1_ASPWE|nr:uncharacterized protein ASPWEDRAFT_34696 [Aspergillus wentii DTO 134E9]KAI9923971.1 hypothetical protein MW887_007429 [Aspergillus wentii]OJJ41198.1 hypothetical protein ASPWEDRAFT_34696 [Aspergillus wentii DTO 134E9]
MSPNRSSYIRCPSNQDGNVFQLSFSTVLRALQAIFAFVTMALYGIDLQHASAVHNRADSSWIYAEMVACISVVICIAHCIFTPKRGVWFIFDFVMVVLWAAQSGLFGIMYIGNHESDDKDFTLSVQRMKAAAGINLVNMVLWCIAAVYGIVCVCSCKRRTKKVDEEKDIERGVEERIQEKPEKEMSKEKEMLKEKEEKMERPPSYES